MAPRGTCFYFIGVIIVVCLDVVFNSAIESADRQNLEDTHHLETLGRVKRNVTYDPVTTHRGNVHKEVGSSRDNQDGGHIAEPSKCFNNVTSDVNGTVYGLFLCPMPGQPASWTNCCGANGSQKCCPPTKDKVVTEKPGPEVKDIDLITGLSIAAVFAVTLTICMSLYCCCCQRRPEIRSGIKMMWVRRSFGKEINRIDNPTYVSHLSPHGRAGSHAGSRSGSRNPSRGPSPSVSRRQSQDRPPASPRLATKSNNPPGDTDALVPSSVTITLTTPSDDQGPTYPLLHTQKVAATT